VREEGQAARTGSDGWQRGIKPLSAMSKKDFVRCSRFIQDEYGIKMPPSKKTLLECRLRKRMRALGMESFEEYVEYAFFSESGHDELIHMIDAVTTNKTDFFREPSQFDVLIKGVLPEVVEGRGAGVRRPLRVWSAGCSTGEEPYSLAMVLSEYRQWCPEFDFSILATDVSTMVLERASRGVYAEGKTRPVPGEMKEKYLMRSKDRSLGLVRVVPELRGRVSFQRLNFMEDDFGVRDCMDVIFCRNVIIYFDKKTQERLINILCDHLLPDGFLFVGHSETLHGMNVPLVQVAPMVYRKAQ
jgi:chemotaxis protein methyltransferase CheR